MTQGPGHRRAMAPEQRRPIRTAARPPKGPERPQHILQRALGNRHLAGLFGSAHRAPFAGVRDDASAEAEADRVARGRPPGVSRTRESDPPAALAADRWAAHLGPGRPLEIEPRQEMESRFATRFDDVVVHRDGRAAAAANALGALAYSAGRHLVFGAGQYAPETETGRRLLAHELTHVVQQREHRAPSAIMRKDGAAPAKPKPSPSPPKECVTYWRDPSLSEKKLPGANLGQARANVEATEVGGKVIKWLNKHRIKVRVSFVAYQENIPQGATGFCDPVGPNTFQVWVRAGMLDYKFVPVAGGGQVMKEVLIDADADTIAGTLFHELLHAWFMSAYPEAGIPTGHTAAVEPELNFLGTTYYDEDQYAPEFLQKLKEFDSQRRALKQPQDAGP